MEWLPIIKDFGFPAILVFYLLFERREVVKALNNNTAAINKLTARVAVHNAQEVSNVLD